MGEGEGGGKGGWGGGEGGEGKGVGWSLLPIMPRYCIQEWNHLSRKTLVYILQKDVKNILFSPINSRMMLV